MISLGFRWIQSHSFLLLSKFVFYLTLEQWWQRERLGLVWTGTGLLWQWIEGVCWRARWVFFVGVGIRRAWSFAGALEATVMAKREAWPCVDWYRAAVTMDWRRCSCARERETKIWEGDAVAQERERERERERENLSLLFH